MSFGVCERKCCCTTENVGPIRAREVIKELVLYTLPTGLLPYQANNKVSLTGRATTRRWREDHQRRFTQSEQPASTVGSNLPGTNLTLVVALLC